MFVDWQPATMRSTLLFLCIVVGLDFKGSRAAPHSKHHVPMLTMIFFLFFVGYHLVQIYKQAVYDFHFAMSIFPIYFSTNPATWYELFPAVILWIFESLESNLFMRDHSVLNQWNIILNYRCFFPNLTAWQHIFVYTCHLAHSVSSTPPSFSLGTHAQTVLSFLSDNR